MRTESVRTNTPFWGCKICGVDIRLTAISQLNQWHVVSIPQYMCRSRPNTQNGYFQTNRFCIFVGLVDCETD